MRKISRRVYVFPCALSQARFGACAQEIAGLEGTRLQSALDEQQRSGGRLGKILQRNGDLNQRQFQQVLRKQATGVAAAMEAHTKLTFPRPEFLSLCMPAYNEADNIEDTLDAACAILPQFVEQFEVVVVNDGSRDHTGSVLDAYARKEPHVRVLHHPRNRGYGAAVSTGLRSARGSLVSFTDSDGQFTFLDFARLLIPIEDYDVVVGYRHPRADTWNRKVNAWGWNQLIRFVLGVRVRDLDCAFKLFRRWVVDCLRLTSEGAAINAEIMSQIQRWRLRIKEIPVSHFHRFHGAPTGANLRVILKAFRELPRLWPFRVGHKASAPPATPQPSLYFGHSAEPTRNGWHAADSANGQLSPNGNGVASRNGHQVYARHAFSGNGAQARFDQLRICQLAACPFPANHGTPGSIREISEGLSALGHDVHVVTYHFGQKIPLTGPKLHRITPWTNESTVVVGPTSRRPLYDLQMIFKTLEVIRQHRPQILHAHGYEAALVAWACRALTNIPVVYSGHNTMADELPSYGFIRPAWVARGLARFLDAVVPRLADRCIPHSANMARFFQEMTLSARTEPVINFGIELGGQPTVHEGSLRDRHGLAEAPVIVYAGVMDEFQRLDLLLEAMQHVVKQEPRAKLLMVVTIPNEKHLAQIRKRSAELDISDRVVLTEPQSLEGVRELLAIADVAVVPRPNAPGFPIKLLNYMAAERPCVLFASSSSGLTHGDNAYLVGPNTSAALAHGILEVLQDASLRQRLAMQGGRYVREHHDRRQVAAKLCAVYRRVLGLSEPARVPKAIASEASLPVRIDRLRVQGINGDTPLPANGERMLALVTPASNGGWIGEEH